MQGNPCSNMKDKTAYIRLSIQSNSPFSSETRGVRAQDTLIYANEWPEWDCENKMIAESSAR